MHSLIILMSLSIAFCLRLFLPTYRRRWQISLFFFLFPPLLLSMTAGAIIAMGYGGRMFGYHSGTIAYIASLLWFGFALWKFIELYRGALVTETRLETYPVRIVLGERATVIDTDFPYSARIGLWDSRLVITEGLLSLLDGEHLEAVLAHEKAHSIYRDTFWFFWLGWVRSISFWLPHNPELWTELVFLRELRADERASEEVDSLLLAESLLEVAKKVTNSPLAEFSLGSGAAFNEVSLSNRLAERIDALIDDKPEPVEFRGRVFILLSLSLAPFLLLPWHS